MATSPSSAASLAAATRRRARRLADGFVQAADAPATVRAYEADWRGFGSWCAAREIPPLPTAPETVGEYLAELGEGYARATLRRKVAAISRACRRAGHPLDTRHPAIRDLLRGIGRLHGSPPKRAQALTTEEIGRLVATCDTDLAGTRDRALLLIGFAGALRRSELCAIEVAHLRFTASGLELLLPRSKTDAEGEGVRLGIPRGRHEATCPVRALKRWLSLSGLGGGPVFRGVTRHGTLRPAALSGEAVRLIVARHARAAGLEATRLEPVSPHGLRAGFITTAYRNGVGDEEIMGHSRHRSLTVMRSYVRRAKLGTASPAGKLGL